MKLLAHALKVPQSVVLGKGVEKVFDGRHIGACVFVQLGHNC